MSFMHIQVFNFNFSISRSFYENWVSSAILDWIINSRNSYVDDMFARHLGSSLMHGWIAEELGLSQLHLVRPEQALLGPVKAGQTWLVTRKSLGNRAVLRFYGIDHISWDELDEFNLDRWLWVDMSVRDNIDQFVSLNLYLKPRLWWLLKGNLYVTVV
jgi:hypothetical protein